MKVFKTKTKTLYMKTAFLSKKHIVFNVLLSIWMIPYLTFSQQYTNEALEPKLQEPGVINLLNGDTLNAWKVPSNHWYFEEESLIGNTGNEALNISEWIHTNQQFSDFEFTCEMMLTGDKRRNTGIYFRISMFDFKAKRANKSYKAASGYEFDAAFHNPEKRDFRGSLGDWFARPSLRVFPDHNIIKEVYKPEEWNRLTIRAQGNRIEYWINGIKIMDYKDEDPEASRKGFIGFQLHSGTVMKVKYRNIRILSLKT